MAEAGESLGERLAASSGADTLAIQILGGRRRSDLAGREPGWQYELAVSWGRLWRLKPPSLHQLGVRALLAFPDLRGVEVGPLGEYRWGASAILSLCWGPMWRIDGVLKGAGGYRGELMVGTVAFGWSLYAGVSHALFGRPELAITLGARFEWIAFRRGLVSTAGPRPDPKPGGATQGLELLNLPRETGGAGGG
jgi:hypothetical protein